MKCRICGCTWEHGCPGGCGWQPGSKNLCTVCAAFMGDLEDYVEACARVTPASLARLLAEVRTLPARRASVHLRAARALRRARSRHA